MRSAPVAEVAGCDQSPQNVGGEVEGHRHGDEPHRRLACARAGEQQQHEEEQHHRAGGLIGAVEERIAE